MSTLDFERDKHLRNAIIRHLDHDPDVDSSAIGVAVIEGIATLTGYIGTCPGKLAAERSAKNVPGVRGVANDLIVRPTVARTDTDIATDVMESIETAGVGVPQVQAAVHHGHVTLTGRAGSLLQTLEATNAARHVPGVIEVTNRMTLAPAAIERNVHHRIVEALHRSATIDARHIAVTVADDLVTLTGSVSTWAQHDAAERAAASAPGIAVIDNQLEVVPTEAV